MAQKLLESIGALEWTWAFGKWYNSVKLCKSGETEGSGMAKKLLESIGALEGHGRWGEVKLIIQGENLKALEWFRSC